jgi:bacillithiol synthase
MQLRPEPGIFMSTSPAVEAYLTSFERIADVFPYDWTRQESMARRAEHLAAHWSGDRTALAAALERFNRAAGCGEATLTNIRLLREPHSLVVVTGQQAGIFTGPAYTIYKAITAIKLARQQSERLGVPVIPIFWIAGEDHDFAEIASVMVPTGDGLIRVQAPGEPPVRTSVAHVLLPEAVSDLIGELMALLPDTEFKAEVERQVRTAAAGGPLIPPYAGPAGSLPVLPPRPTYADWFARLIAWLFRDAGLVLLHPVDPDLRRLAGSFFLAAIERHEQVDAALQAGIDRWRRLGFAPTVERQAGSLNLFTYVKGERLPLAGAGDQVWVRDREETGWSRAELLERARRRPEWFSTNVVLRPAIQNALLPDLATVAGPGEISYWGLYGDVFAVFGQELPIIYPRLSVTLIEPALARYLEKQELTLPDVIHHLDRHKAELLEREDSLGLSSLFASFRDEMLARHEQLVETILLLDKTLAFVAEENRKQILVQIQKLEEKARQQHRKNCDVALRQFDRLAAHLHPGGGLQERAVSIVPYLVKYGPDLVSRLLAELDVTDGRWTHHSAGL